MKSLKVSKDSWHYKLSQWFESYEVENLCGYVWRVIYNMFRTLWALFLVLATILFALIPFITGAMWLYGIPLEAGVIIAAVVIGCIEVVLLLIISRECIEDFKMWVWKKKNPTGTERDYYEYLRDKRKHEQENPSFIKMMWTTFKEKTCYRLEVDDE